jgi:dTDP-glucose 4,6-dehydratase
MERILLTGVTGFVGSELAAKLLDLNYEVHTIERYVTGRYQFSNSSKHITHHANLVDYQAIRKVVRDVQPDYVVHLAAISPVAFSYDHYMEVIEANFLATINLAEACYREANAFKQFLFAGTSEEYGTTLGDTNSKLNENSELNPNSPYSVAKVSSDLYLRYMYKAYNFPYTILRPFNTYGRKDNTHFFIERVITSMLKNGKVLLGAPDAVRDWLYIDDHVDGYIKAIGNKKAVGQTIQLCTGKGYTTKEASEMIAKQIGFKGEIVWNSTPERPLDAKFLVGDNSKAKELLGWEPKYTFEEGIRKTISYLSSKK